jgi:hypothetical protein
MTKGEQARLTAWRLKVLRQAADERNVARPEVLRPYTVERDWCVRRLRTTNLLQPVEMLIDAMAAISCRQEQSRNAGAIIRPTCRPPPSLPALVLGPTKSPLSSGPAGWARSNGRATPGSIAMSRSRSCYRPSPMIQTASLVSVAKPRCSPHCIVRTSRRSTASKTLKVPRRWSLNWSKVRRSGTAWHGCDSDR